MIAEASPMAPAAGLSRSPRPASAFSSREGCGFSTAAFFRSSPSPSQPSSRAPPIFPAPTSRMVPERWASVRAPVIVIALFPRSSLARAAGRQEAAGRQGASSLASGFEHGGVERLARSLAGPDHELEGREVAFAGVERSPEQRLALPARGLYPA